ncbi:putative G-protein coupled receptor B0563.6 [Mytilus galloprovincialis]|uniref:putative G-protein coupled receptor B0563.6 n=1 Tax=Mytilus galloprovincialis TaxID=29158 RepID=UPI003F7C759D
MIMNSTIVTMTTFNDSDVSSETYPSSNQVRDEVDMVAVICNKYIGPILCVAGVFGNILNLIILIRGRLNNPPYFYLKALAVTDMCALVLSFLHLMVSNRSTLYEWKFFDAYLFFPLVNFFTASSVWLTVGVTIDRFLYVKAPLWARAQFSLNRAKVRIAIILVATIFITVPRFLCFSLVGATNQYHLYPTSFRASHNYRVYDIVCIALFHVAPLVIFVFCNSYLIYAVHKARSIRKEYDIRNNKEKDWQLDQRRFTITLISIVLLSIIAILPSTIGDFTRLLHIPFSHYHKLRHISNMLLLLNLSVNFLLYCAFNKRFVRVMKSMFGGGLIKVKLSIRRTKSSRYSRTETNMYM